jgi:hypothetical protein
MSPVTALAPGIGGGRDEVAAQGAAPSDLEFLDLVDELSDAAVKVEHDVVDAGPREVVHAAGFGEEPRTAGWQRARGCRGGEGQALPARGLHLDEGAGDDREEVLSRVHRGGYDGPPRLGSGSGFVPAEPTQRLL